MAVKFEGMSKFGRVFLPAVVFIAAGVLLFRFVFVFIPDNIGDILGVLAGVGSYVYLLVRQGKLLI